jgi:hypothetical protein
MLNFILNKKANYTKGFSKLDIIKSSKHYPSSSREWKSSIYAYNKNNLNLIPTTDLSAISIIKNYFSLFNRNIEKKLRTKRIRWKSRRYSNNKVYISNGEFKHSNNKVIINLYLFNRQNKNYLFVIKKIIKKKLMKYKIKRFLKKMKLLKKSILFFVFSNQTRLLKNINNLRIRNYIIINIEKFCDTIVSVEKNRRLLYWYYKQIKYINKSKFTYTYLQYLKEQLFVLYNKQIEFNFINLKRFYLNSDILSEFITKKITYNRKKVSRYLTKLKNKIRIRRKNSSFHIKKLNNKLLKKNKLTQKTLSKLIIRKLKYRHITGFRLEARGRLTRRYTASRSLLKTINRGNLLNIDSSLKHLPSVLLKGNLKSNVQYTKLASKSRIGSFGVKGWISGY